MRHLNDCIANKNGLFNKYAMLTGTAYVQHFGGPHYGKYICNLSEVYSDFNVSMKVLKKPAPATQKK